MYSNIEQLEKEIETFKANLSDSNELMQMMKVLATSASKQNNALQEQLGEVSKVVSTVPETIRGDYAELLQGFSQSKSAYEAYITAIKNSVTEINVLPSKLEQVNIDLLKKALSKLLDVQAVSQKDLQKSNEEFCKQISEYKSHISSLELELKTVSDSFEQKHDEFLQLISGLSPENLQKLESLENIQVLCQENADAIAKIEVTQIQEHEKLLAQIASTQEAFANIKNEGSSSENDVLNKTVLSMQKELTNLQNEIENWREWESQGRQAELEKIDEMESGITNAVSESVTSQIARLERTIMVNSSKIDVISLALEKLDKQNEAEDTKSPYQRLLPIYIGLGATILLSFVSLFIR
ncbi:MAG: hypothetical protein FWF76_06165 [Oscillospiraceae bacterium]|nr:hypothetical protein [Oscillospiraceae bacterium]